MCAVSTGIFQMKTRREVAVEERHLWRVQLQCAVDARRHAGEDDSGVSFEALCSSVNERDDGAGVQDSVFIAQEGYLEKATSITTHDTLHVYAPRMQKSLSYQHPVHPAAGNDGVQSTDDDVELCREMSI